MEFDEHVEIGIQPTSQNYEAVDNSGRGRTNGSNGGYRYKECLKNHAVGIGGLAVDGCREFMAAGDEGTLEALKCAACNCHRNFHRKEPDGQDNNFHHHPMTPASYYYNHRPSGYLHVMTAPSPLHHRPLALPSTTTDDVEEMSNPSYSGGGGSKKRFRTKFTQYQKDRMLPFADALGWRIQKEDEATVQQFCQETGIKRKVLKVWMHNNKQRLGVYGGDIPTRPTRSPPAHHVRGKSNLSSGKDILVGVTSENRAYRAVRLYWSGRHQPGANTLPRMMRRKCDSHDSNPGQLPKVPMPFPTRLHARRIFFF